jgi:hypothetical protein
MPNGDINGFTFTGSSFDGTAKNTDTSQSAPVSRFGNTSIPTSELPPLVSPHREAQKEQMNQNIRSASLQNIILGSRNKDYVNPNPNINQTSKVNYNPIGMADESSISDPRNDVMDKIMKLVTAPARTAVSGTGEGLQSLIDAGDQARQGNIGTGILEGASGLAQTGMSLATPFVPVMSGFDIGGQALENVGGGDVEKYGMSPVESLTNPTSIAGKSGAKLADLLYNLLLFKGVDKGIEGIKNLGGESNASTVRGNQEVIPEAGKEPERGGEISGNDIQRTQTGGSQAGDERIGQQGTEKKTTQNVEGINQGFTEVKPITKQGEQTPEGFTEVKPTTKELPKFSNPRNPKPAKAASDINKALVAKGFEELPPDEISNYSSITKEDQINKSATLLETDYEASKNMAKTGKGIPRGVNPQVLFNAVKNKALSENDYETLKDLASSPIARARSKAAQTLGASGFNNTASELDPVQIMQDVERAKENNFQQRTGAKDIDALKNRTVDQISKQIKKHNLQPKDWTSFIESIRCK